MLQEEKEYDIGTWMILKLIKELQGETMMKISFCFAFVFYFIPMMLTLEIKENQCSLWTWTTW